MDIALEQDNAGNPTILPLVHMLLHPEPAPPPQVPQYPLQATIVTSEYIYIYTYLLMGNMIRSHLTAEVLLRLKPSNPVHPQLQVLLRG